MTDQSQNATDAEESDAEDTDDEEFELEGLMTCEQGASALRRLATGVESGSVALGRDEGPVTVPERFEVEVEYEAEEEEAELEVELEWSMGDSEAVHPEDDENDGTKETEASGQGTDDLGDAEVDVSDGAFQDGVVELPEPGSSANDPVVFAS